MGSDVLEVAINFGKMVAIFLLMVQIVPLLVWVERRGSAFIQNRFGPNRVGPLGLTQLLADAVKFLTKEEFVPAGSYRLIFYAAPIIALIPAALALNAIPLSVPLSLESFQWLGKTWGPYQFVFQGYDVGVGIVFVLGVSSLGAYSLLMAGWGSSSKFSLLGALRASAQMVSYELAMGLALVGILMIYNTLGFHEMIAQQTGPLTFSWMGHPVVISFLPNWGIFFQPIGAILFFSSVFAETNRLPFDLSEAEGELVAGYHTEYGGIKMNMFYIGEYGHMLVASALLATFYFGGYNLPFISPDEVRAFIASQGYGVNATQLLAALALHLVLMAKIVFFLWIFIWVRWTLPRFRYDQLMDLGWKTMLPWALGNAVVTAIVIFVLRTKWGA